MKLYQIKNVAKVPYAFRDYNEEVFNLEDYDLVMNEFYSETESVKEDLDYLFQMGNIPEFIQKYKIRSISISDVIELGNHLYYCNSFGWIKIK